LRSAALRYGVAALAVALVVALKLLLDPLIEEQSPFLILSVAVIVAAWFGGLGPGLLATALGALAADYFFLLPRGSFTGLGAELLPLGLFAVQGLVISSLTEALHAARSRAEASAQVAISHQENLRLSEERFRLLIEGVEDYAIIMLEPDGRVASWNAGAERINGYRAEEIVGEHFSRFYTEEDLERGHPEHELRVAASEGRFEEEGLRVRKDGSRFWASVLVSPLRDQGGNLRGFAKVTRDVTERKRAEEALRQSEARYRAVIEQAAEGIFVVDVPTRRILEANAAYKNVLGYTTEEMLGLTLYDVVAHDRESVDRHVRRILEDGAHVVGERRHRRKDGSLVDVEVSSSVVSFGGGEALCVVAHDVTERKRAVQRLRESLANLLALYEAGKILGSSLEREEIGSRLLEIMQNVSSVTAAVVNLRDERGELRAWRTFGEEDVLASVRDEPEFRAARRAVLEKSRGEKLLGPPATTRASFAVALFVPLRVRGGTIGVLEAYGPQPLAEKQAVETLTSLASQAASALENARLYEELAERERRLHDLVGQVLTAQEEERRRIAYEVHDGLTQTAVAAYQLLQNFADDYFPESAKGRGELNEAVGLVQRTVSEARQVIADLRPTVLDDLGLATAVGLQVEKLREEGCRTTYEDTLGNERLPTTLESALFRVAQEALTNVRKHARTDRVHVALERRDGTVRLRVRDWGRGFSPQETTNGGGPGERVGLSSMQERVALLGGRFEVASEPGAGTLVAVEVPLSLTEGGTDGYER
jgi:PAS domain S-box-containing protein